MSIELDILREINFDEMIKNFVSKTLLAKYFTSRHFHLSHTSILYAQHSKFTFLQATRCFTKFVIKFSNLKNEPAIAFRVTEGYIPRFYLPRSYEHLKPTLRKVIKTRIFSTLFYQRRCQPVCVVITNL